MILYSTNCPKCNVLKTKLDNKGLNYEIVTDVDVMMAKGFKSAPILEDDNGNIMTFTDAIKFVNGLGVL